MRFVFTVALVASLTLGCTPTQRAGLQKALSTADAVSRGVSKVLSWCEEHDASIDDVIKAHKALKEKNYLEAANLAAKIVEGVGEHEAVPEEIAVLTALVRGAAAAQAIDDGMSAVSQ